VGDGLLNSQVFLNMQGNLATVTKVIPQCGIQMAVYDSVKDYFQTREPDKKLTSMQRLMAGAEDAEDRNLPLIGMQKYLHVPV